MDELQERIWDYLCLCSAEEVLKAFIKYNGVSLLDEGFAEFLSNEYGFDSKGE